MTSPFPGPGGPGGPTDPTRPMPFPQGPGQVPPPLPGGPGGPGLAPAPTSPHQPAPPRRTGRILGRALLVLLVVAALAATTAWGFANRSSAEKWKDRSERADAALERSLAEVETTRAEVEDARERLRELAAEKAGETDRNRILSEIVSQAPEVTEAMRDCQQETTRLANEILDSFGDPAAASAIQDRIDEVNQICEVALDAAADLEAAVDELGL